MIKSKTAKPYPRPDCPRQYHDDYEGYPTKSRSGSRLIIAVIAAGTFAALAWGVGLGGVGLAL